MLELQVVYERRWNRVAILQMNRDTEAWFATQQLAITRLMDGLAGETPVVSDALLAEIGRKLGALAAETSGRPVRVRYATGTVAGVTRHEHVYQAGLAELERTRSN